MDTARDKITGICLSAEELWLLESVDKDRYVCPDCGVQVNPVSFARGLKRRPHFKLFPETSHGKGCYFEEQQTEKRSGRKSSRKIGVPASYPSRLILEPDQDRASTISDSDRNLEPSSDLGHDPRKPNRKQHSYAVSTIRSLARHYLRYPNGRHLPLKVDGLAGATYRDIFQRVDPDRSFGGARLFYGNQKFNGLARHQSGLSVTLT